MNTTTMIILAIVVLLILFIIATYNKLVMAKSKVKNAWSQIDVQLQRRFDLIPNLVETVKGYMDHEANVLKEIAALRTSWANATTIQDKADIDNKISSALKTIMAVSENYPDLKANENFTSLQEQLAETENKISYSRQFYNDTVTRYNVIIATFPSNIIAGLFRFDEEQLFEAESKEARQNVKVDFNK